MPIKIFAAPGNHRNDFQAVEEQVNDWIEQAKPRVLSVHPLVNAMPGKGDLGEFMLTLVAHYEASAP